MPKLFKFFKFWIKHPRFMDLVKEAWMTQVEGSPLIRVCRKLKLLKGLLKKLNRDDFSDISERVRMKESELVTAQAEALNHPTTSAFEEEIRISKEARVLREAEESFFRQKSREIWLKEGDSNTPYFHNSVKSRQKRNMIRSLINENGQRVTDNDGMAGIAERFYRELLGKCDPEVIPPEVDQIKSILLKKLMPEQSVELCSHVTAEEVKTTLFGFDGEKALGLMAFLPVSSKQHGMLLEER
ncbi:unnamed protein product [Linum trigynum]|uniref:Uncharacterized protein n=1 Tax=Linum trigynum TaxID=586398 RepID=A0AAV2G874_9ROSI